MADDIAYGAVRATFVRVDADGPDGDLAPDELALSGVVTLTPSFAALRVLGERPRIAVLRTVECPVVGGRLCSPDTLAPDVFLAAFDQPSASPSQVQWTAEFRLEGAVAPAPVTFNVPAGGVVDLATVVAEFEAPGVITVVSDETRQRAEAAAQAATDAAARAVDAAERAGAEDDAAVALAVGTEGSQTRAALDALYVTPAGQADALAPYALAADVAAEYATRAALTAEAAAREAGDANAMAAVAAEIELREVGEEALREDISAEAERTLAAATEQLEAAVEGLRTEAAETDARHSVALAEAEARLEGAVATRAPLLHEHQVADIVDLAARLGWLETTTRTHPIGGGAAVAGYADTGRYSVDDPEVAHGLGDLPVGAPGLLEVVARTNGGALQRYTTEAGLTFTRTVRDREPVGRWTQEGIWFADPSTRRATLDAVRWGLIGGIQASFPDGAAGDVRTTLDGAMWRRGDDLLGEWRNATLENGWANYADVYSGARYARTGAGIVVLNGLIKGAAAGQAAFTLPEGYRPAHRMMFATVAGGGDARVDVHANGMVRVEWATVGSAALGWVSLSPIMFPAADIAPNAAWTNITTWHEGFAPYGDGGAWPIASYWQDPLGRVWFRGMATRSAALSGGDINMFSVPGHLRLGHQSHRFSCASNPLRGVDIINTEVRAKGSLSPQFVSLTQCAYVPHDVLPLEGYVALVSSSDYPEYGASYPGPHAAVFSDGLVFMEGLLRGSAQRVRITTLAREVTPTWGDSGRRNTAVFAASSNNGRARVDIGTDPHAIASDLPLAWIVSDAVPGPWLSLGGVHFYRAGWGK